MLIEDLQQDKIELQEQITAASAGECRDDDSTEGDEGESHWILTRVLLHPPAPMPS